MGDKTSRAPRMQSTPGVPVVPGTLEPLADDGERSRARPSASATR